MMAGSTNQADKQFHVQLQRLKKDELKAVLARIGAPKSGIKSALVARVVECMKDSILSGTIKQTVASLLYSNGQSKSGRSGPSVAAVRNRVPKLQFSDSPFLVHPIPISDVVRLTQGSTRILGYHDKSMVFKFKLREADVNKLDDERSVIPSPPGGYKIFLRCGEVGQGNSVITEKFPRTIRWYMNGKLIKEASHSRYSSVEVSRYLMDFISEQNIQIELIQGKTQQPKPDLSTFAMQLFLAQKIPPEQLLPKVQQQSKCISLDEYRAKAVQYLNEGSTDEDVSCGMTVVSIRCPLSQTRMENPTRGSNCAHVQCFDALSYLLFNARKTAWTCPICAKPAPLKCLRVDSWFQKIVQEAPPDAIEVEVMSSGEWRPKELANQSSKQEAPRKRIRPGPDKSYWTQLGYKKGNPYARQSPQHPFGSVGADSSTGAATRDPSRREPSYPSVAPYQHTLDDILRSLTGDLEPDALDMHLSFNTPTAADGRVPISNSYQSAWLTQPLEASSNCASDYGTNAGFSFSGNIVGTGDAQQPIRLLDSDEEF